MTFVGFDLHKRYLTACALDAAGQLVAERKQLSTALDSVVAWLATLPGPLSIGVEATLYWEWLTTKLRTLGHTVEVAHAFQVKLIWQARAKKDLRMLRIRFLFYSPAGELLRYGTLRHSTGESVRDVLPARPHCEQCTNQQFQ